MLRIAIDKTAAPPAIRPGETITYTLTLTNLLTFTTTQVTLRDTIPQETIFLSATSPYKRDGKRVTWSFPVLGPYESRTVELVVRV
jgi:uncharacterized repeat protein (TIGR01451 family)